MTSLFSIYIEIMLLGFFAWLMHIGTYHDEQRASRRWILFTVLWPIGLLVVLVHGIKTAVEEIKVIFK